MPTVRPVSVKRKTTIALIATTPMLFRATTKVAAFGRHHKRDGAGFGRATSSAVSFVVAMNRLDVVALNTIFALRLSKTRRTVGRTDSRLDGWSVHTNDWSGKSDCQAVCFSFIIRYDSLRKFLEKVDRSLDRLLARSTARSLARSIAR